MGNAARRIVRNYASIVRPGETVAMLIALYKPYGVLCQFSSSGDRQTLADLLAVRDVYPAGRLDFDSEGLVLLTDEGPLQHSIASPGAGLEKRYWVQVEGIPGENTLERLRSGIEIGNGRERFWTRPASVTSMSEPPLATRQPPIRQRLSIPTAWLHLCIHEGRNRQVRRMTAAIGHPTLRLVRVGIGAVDLFALGLTPGAWREIDAALVTTVSGTVDRTPRNPRPPLSTGRRHLR